MHFKTNFISSLEKVSKEVEGTKGDIEKLEIGLAGTKVVIKRVGKMVDQHGKQIKKNKTKLKEVDGRVDVVEQDLVEAKELLEIVGLKVRTHSNQLLISVYSVNSAPIISTTVL